MQKQFEIIRRTRDYLLQELSDLSIAQVNEIPPGFNNNIAWNVGHMIAAQQGVCYARNEIPMQLNADFFQMYRPGSRPERIISVTEWEEIKLLSVTTIDQLQQDYEARVFAEFKTWTNRYGVTLASIKESINFLVFHEGLHSGIATALRRVVTAN